MQEDAGPQQVEVDFGIQVLDAVGRLENVEHVLQQAAVIGVMRLDAGRRLHEVAHQVLVGQEALHQHPQMAAPRSPAESA